MVKALLSPFRLVQGRFPRKKETAVGFRHRAFMNIYDIIFGIGFPTSYFYPTLSVLAKIEREKYMDVRRWLPGDLIRYTGCSDDQVRWGGNDDPRGVLEVGSTYSLYDIKIHTNHTKVWVDGGKGAYNSVCFEWVSGHDVSGKD